MQMSTRRQYPRVLSGKQVWVGGRGPPRPTCMHSHLRVEKELMKWPRSAISRSPHTGVTNEPPEREQGCRVAMAEASWQLSFYSPYPQGDKKNGLFPIFTFYKLGAWFTLWRQAAVIFSARWSNLEFSWEVTIFHGVWLFIAGSSPWSQGGHEIEKRQCSSSFSFKMVSVWLVEGRPEVSSCCENMFLQDKWIEENYTRSHKQWRPTANSWNIHGCPYVT